MVRTELLLAVGVLVQWKLVYGVGAGTDGDGGIDGVGAIPSFWPHILFGCITSLVPSSSFITS